MEPVSWMDGHRDVLKRCVDVIKGTMLHVLHVLVCSLNASLNTASRLAFQMKQKPTYPYSHTCTETQCVCTYCVYTPSSAVLGWHLGLAHAR